MNNCLALLLTGSSKSSVEYCGACGHQQESSSEFNTQSPSKFRLQFPNAFFTRWIHVINPKHLGDVSAGVPGESLRECWEILIFL